jgi:hypothetical protein
MNIGHIGPNFLLSLNMQPMKWHVALGELCDNSFDAGANRVEICFNPKRELEVIDDGSGCDNIEKMLTLGEHYRQSTTKLGRYGVGLKEAACWLWGELIIKTNCKGRGLKAAIDWGKLSKQDDWNVPDPIEVRDVPIGTRLTFRNTSKSWPDYDKLRDELGYTFAPALRHGKQIVIRPSRRKPITCAGWQLPDMSDIVQDRFEVNGKRVRIEVGIVDFGVVNSRRGFSICHGHRIIANTVLGARHYSTANICGMIELDAAWSLSKNKTELVDSDQDLLEEAIFSRCEHILKKASSQAEEIRNTALEDAVSESLQSILTERRKEKRDRKRNESGTVEPKNTKRKRQRASKCQPGEAFLQKCNVGTIRMEWEDRTDGQLGRVDLHGPRIFLNGNHPRLNHHRHSENKDALVDHCLTLLSFEAVESSQRDKLPFARDSEGFIDALSNVLQSQQETQNASLAAAQ